MPRGATNKAVDLLPRRGRPTRRSNRDEVLDHLIASDITSRDLMGGLTSKLLRRLPKPPPGRAFYELGDRGPNAVGGLRVRVGRRNGIIFSVVADFRPAPSAEFVTARVTLGKWGDRESLGELSLKRARDKAAIVKAELRNGVDHRRKAIRAKEEAAKAAAPREVTLRTAYEHYLKVRTGKKRKPLSPSTAADYKRVIERALADFADKSLREIADDPRDLIEHFDEVGKTRPAEANTRMRVVRAVWNRAHKVMPAQVPPAPAIFDLNEVEARDAGFVTAEVSALWKAIDAIEEPQRKKGVLTYLFLGLRDGAVLPMRKEHIDRNEMTVFIPYTKGKRLKLPLSALALSLLEAPTPENLVDIENPYVFASLRGPRPSKRKSPPAEGETIERWTHIDNIDCSDLPVPAAYLEQRGEKARCHPHAFRHTYRTLATSANVADVAIRLLMGHSLKGDVSFDYLTADLDWLRQAQEKISAYILKSAGQPSDFTFPADYFVKPEAPTREGRCARRASPSTRIRMSEESQCQSPFVPRPARPRSAMCGQ